MTADVTAALEAFDTAAAGRRLAAFIDDLSNWYVRRSRRRFWDGPRTPDGAAAFATLYECVNTLTRLMAPIVPFVTDYVWGVLRAAEDAGFGAPGAVAWLLTRTLIDARFPPRWRLVRRLVELGRSARAAASIRIRQPLGARAGRGAGIRGRAAGELRVLIAAELNVALAGRA